VEDDQLDELIRSHEVKKFMRSEGWVAIGINSIREFDEDFVSPEKGYTIRGLSRCSE